MKRIFFTFLILLLPNLGFSRISVDVSPQEAAKNEPFIVSIVFRAGEIPGNHEFPKIANISDFTLDKTDTLEEVRRDFFLGNFKVKEYRFHLRSKVEGRRKIGPISWKIAGKTIALGTAVIYIKRAYSQPGLRVKAYLDNNELYEGQQCRLSLQMSFYGNYQGEMRYNLDPDFGADFWVEHFTKPEIRLRNKQTIPGARTGDVVMAHLFPARSGNLTIDPFVFRYMKKGPPKKVVQKRPGFYFESTTQEPIPDSATTQALHLRVKPLPPGKPVDFSGLVGSYKFRSSIDKTSLKVGEALTLTFVLTGNGRPKTEPKIVLEGLDQFRQIPPESSVKNRERHGLIESTRTIKYFLYPKQKGDFKIPPAHLSIFDPRSKSYKTLHGKPFQIHVEAGAPVENSTLSAQPNFKQKQIRRLGEDIRHIHKPAILTDRSQNFYQNPFFYLLFLLPPFFTLGMGILAKKHREKSGNATLERRSKAGKKARQQLKQVQKLSSANKPFLDLLQSTLTEYLSARTGVEFLGLTSDLIQKTLLEKGVSEELIQKYLNLNELCDRIRFSGSTNSMENHSSLISSANELLDSWEKIL